jgi:hypothetical protein
VYLKNSLKVILVTISVILITIAIFAASSTVSFFVLSSKSAQNPSINSTTSLKPIQAESHVHAALMVFVNEKAINFSSVIYQNQDLLSHFENDDGVILHNHSKRVWLGMFFQTINMTLAKNCLTLDDGSSYCSDFDKQIAFVVNGKQNTKFQHYIPKDGDRILISYGKPERIKAELDMLNSIQIPRV